MGGGEEEKNKGEGYMAAPPPHQHQYGTFQGAPGYPPPPVMGFPQPAPPPGITGQPYPHPNYPHGYQAVQGYEVHNEGRHMRERRLPCCGIGIGWFLFITGFFLAAIPWYVGAFMLCVSRVDYREKPGYVACVIAAVIATIAVVFGAANFDWD
ncbi:hypothetical protein LUZ60_009963 [Juncus effusus]|nr:hypothetical protein LUZ60_009963 [Juncus effusus]